ncbi:phage Gp37/Gp68 family protein [Frankia gtarii]|uniref:phage Gp37/Gp68 family protein n=1 Tax=Frankia gtarii TaxID=2950102 RepID=UPI0021C07B03|nr:phage Gp37/Gp68 family protein [Frankia gtarii]
MSWYHWELSYGCDRVSPGCDGCSAIGAVARFSERKPSRASQRSGNPARRVGKPFEGLVQRRDIGGLDWTGRVNLRPGEISKPLHRKEHTRWFVDPNSDLFHPAIPDGFLGDVWATMAATPQHAYQILTKRPARARALLNRWAAAGWTWRGMDGKQHGPIDGPLPNVWVGTSAEDQHHADIRMAHLRETPAAVRWVSLQPLLGPIDLDLTGIGWVDVGGEIWSEARKGRAEDRWPRPLELEWVRSIRDQCAAAGVPFALNELGFRWAAEAEGRDPNGKDPFEWPPDLRIRQLPKGTRLMDREIEEFIRKHR